VDDASALEITLERLRQRYALHFNVPPGVKQGQERSISVDLTAAALRRHPGAELRFRRTYTATATTGPASSVHFEAEPAPEPTTVSGPVPERKRRPTSESRPTKGPLGVEP
jgi:hypothetical protein